jgi:hypothetical protein
MTDREDKKRDHTLRPEWLTKHDPLPLPTLTKRDELQSLARRMIAANAIRRYREDGEQGWVSYSRRKNWYAEHPSRFYWPKWFSHTYIVAAVGQMENASQLVHDQKRPGNRHWQSRLRATEKMMGFDTKLQYDPKYRVILRDEEKNDVAYDNKAQIVVEMLRDIDEINAYLLGQTITLDGKILKEGDPLYVDLHCVTGALRISTRRIFHARSFNLGGRWWNDLQNIPGETRSRLRLNGQPIAIHDYSAFYPKLLYAMVGAVCDGDPYTIPEVPRHISKPILNILINAKTGTAAVRAAAQELKLHVRGGQAERHAKARSIIAALKRRNEPIARFFHSDAGKRLMHYEAFLLHDNMRDLMKRGIPLLPLHDALIAPADAHRELVRIMTTNLATLLVTLAVQYRALKSASSPGLINPLKDCQNSELVSQDGEDRSEVERGGVEEWGEGVRGRRKRWH